MAQKPISQIKLPNGSTYNIDKGIYYIEGAGSTDTTNKVATWLGSHNDIPAYYNGLTILYKISTAGSTTTTLNINNLGAVSVVKNVNSAISTSYAVGSIVTLTYTTDEGTAYWKCADYDANTKTTTGTSNKASTKLFLTGATSQTSSGTTTYSNSKVYIGTDNCLYSNGAKVLTSYTDTNDKVTNELATTTKAYITGTTSATTNTGTQIFDTGVYLDTTAGQLVATTFKGALDGNAKTASSATKDASGNTITSTYETKSAATSKLTEAKTYADTVAATIKNDLLNGAGAAYDTLKELGDLIDDNQDAIEALETVAAGKANVKHTHAKSEITDFPTSMPASDVPAWAKASTKPSYTANEVGALPISGGTLTGILYTTASTPLFIGSNGKVGMRASTSDKANVGQINVSNAWYNNGNQWGSQISAYNGTKDAYNEFRVSHNGLEYNCDDGKTYTVLHTGNISSQSIAASKVTGLATVATSGSYNDLSNKPTIPTVNNATLTIQKNGTTIKTFTANSSSNVTANITVPTGAAADKGVDTSISAASTSTNLPTSKAVAAFVEGKGYITSYNNGYHTTGSWNGLTYTATANGGAGELKFTIPTGTSSTTVAVGNHTHNYAGSSSAGGAATSANKVNTNLTIKLNGGSTEGTNLFTFNGSTAKTLNITASSIGAAPAYTYQTTDPGAGSSLAAGKLLIVYS